MSTEWIISGSGAQCTTRTNSSGTVSIPHWMKPDVVSVYHRDGAMLNYTLEHTDAAVIVKVSRQTTDAVVLFTSDVIRAVFSYIMLVNDNYEYQRLSIQYYIDSPQPFTFSKLMVIVGMQQPGDLCDSTSCFKHDELTSGLRYHMPVNSVCCERFFHFKQHRGRRQVTVCYEVTPSQSLPGGKFTIVSHHGSTDQLSTITSPAEVSIHNPKVLCTTQVESWSSANKVTITVGTSSKVSAEFKKPVKKLVDYNQLAYALDMGEGVNRDTLVQNKAVEITPNIVTTVYDIKVRNTTAGYVKLHVDIDGVDDMIYYVCDKPGVILANYSDNAYTFILPDVPSAVVPQGLSAASVMTSGRSDFNASTDYIIQITHMLSPRKY